MTQSASIGRIVSIDVDGAPTPAIITHVHGAHENGADVVDLTAFPREAAPRTFAGVNLHADADAAADDDHNLVAHWPARDEGVNESDVDDVDQGDDVDQVDGPAAAPAPAKKATKKAAAGRR